LKAPLLLIAVLLVGGCASHRAPVVAPSPSPSVPLFEGLVRVSPSASPTPSSSPSPTRPSVRAAPAPARSDLADPRRKDIAMQLLSSAENSSLDWRAQYSYIEDINDGRGYTGGIVGFCSGTGDMLRVVQNYKKSAPGNVLAKYLPALQAVDGSDSHAGLDPGFTGDWKAAAGDRRFQAAQDAERDRMYFDPALSAAHQDGVRPLGQFAYFDAIVMHGADGLAQLRRKAAAVARPPAQGGDETAYLNAFLDARVALMKTEEAHHNTTRVDTEQRVFLRDGNLDLDPPLAWKVYNTPFSIP
jgi:chitosanase